MCIRDSVRLGDGRLKRIKVHDNEINWLDGVLLHCSLVSGIAADVEQSAVHERMQSFNATIEHFGKAGVLGNIFHGQAGFAERLGGATGGNKFDADGGEDLGEGHEAGFVGNGEQGTLNFHVQ